MYINPFACELLGIDPQKALGQQFSRVVHFTTREAIDPFSWMVAINTLGGRTPCLETFFLDRHQQPRAISWTRAPRFDAEGETVSIMVTGVEETRLKQMTLLADHLAIQMLLSQISTHLLKAHGKHYHPPLTTALSFLGKFSRSDCCFILQKKSNEHFLLFSCWHDHGNIPKCLTADPTALPLKVHDALLRHETVFFAPNDPPPDRAGSLLPAQDNVSIILSPIIENKQVVGGLGMASRAMDRRWKTADMDLLRRSAEFFGATLARIRAEHEKEKIDKRYRLLVDKSPLGICTINRSGHTTHFNPQMKTIMQTLGFDLASPINMLTHPALNEIGFSTDVNACLGGRSIPAIIHSFTSPKGQTHYFRTHMTALGEKQNIHGVQIIVEEITPIYKAEQKLKENERFLNSVLNALKTGVIIIDPETHCIVDVNPYAAQLMDRSIHRLTGKACHEIVCSREKENCPVNTGHQRLDNVEDVLLTRDGNTIPILKSVSRIRRNGRRLLLTCFTDIRELKQLLEEQQLDIQASKNILSVINGPFPRHTPLQNGLSLFSTAFYRPCLAEGGDHFFIRTIKDRSPTGACRTIISLKDQSGHQVGCILRSIITDLLHQSILSSQPLMPLDDTLNHLNNLLGQGSFIDPDCFCTAVVLCLDHATLSLQYVLCGHPRFLQIRNGSARYIPDKDQRQGINLPLGLDTGLCFSSGEIALEPGDKLILCTDGFMETGIGPRNHETASATSSIMEILRTTQEKEKQLLTEPVERIMEKMVAAACETATAEGTTAPVYAPHPDDITVMALEIEKTTDNASEKWQIKDLGDMQRHIDRFLGVRHREWKARGFLRFIRLQVCLEEAVCNAWKHGNRKTPGKVIHIRYRWGNDFHLSIADQGSGFDVSALPDPRVPGVRERPSGRGIFMIRRNACAVSFSPKGNTIYMRFSAGNASPEFSQRTSQTHNASIAPDVFRHDHST